MDRKDRLLFSFTYLVCNSTMIVQCHYTLWGLSRVRGGREWVQPCPLSCAISQEIFCHYYYYPAIIPGNNIPNQPHQTLSMHTYSLTAYTSYTTTYTYNTMHTYVVVSYITGARDVWHLLHRSTRAQSARGLRVINAMYPERA